MIDDQSNQLIFCKHPQIYAKEGSVGKSKLTRNKLSLIMNYPKKPSKINNKRPQNRASDRSLQKYCQTQNSATFFRKQFKINKTRSKITHEFENSMSEKGGKKRGPTFPPPKLCWHTTITNCWVTTKSNPEKRHSFCPSNINPNYVYFFQKTKKNYKKKTHVNNRCNGGFSERLYPRELSTANRRERATKVISETHQLNVLLRVLIRSLYTTRDSVFFLKKNNAQHKELIQ